MGDKIRKSGDNGKDKKSSHRVTEVVPDTAARWDAEQRAALLEVVHDHWALGHYVQGGFKSIFWNAVRLEFNKKKNLNYSKTQIQSQFAALKAAFQIVSSLRAVSGFGWNEERQLVMADEEVWRPYLAAHPEATMYRTHSLPMYDTMADIFLGSMATGQFAMASTSRMYGEHEKGQASDSGGSSGDSEEEEGDYSDSERPPAAVPIRLEKRNARAESGKKEIKRTRTTASTERKAEVTALMTRLVTAHESVLTRQTPFAAASALFAELYAFQFSVEQCLGVKMLFADSSSKCELFMSLSEAERDVYIEKIVSNL
jgi:hypothetical protein